MKSIIYLLIFSSLLFQSCTHPGKTNASTDETLASYFKDTGNDDMLSGGIKMVTIKTSSGEFKVWTKRIGNNPKIKVLLLHGGPGFTHEYLECFDSYFPREGIEYYYYDQLGSYYSDQPDDMTPYFGLDRFVDEVEQVRNALNLTPDNFYLFGHSWGGILAIEYALKYQQNLKGLIISNMMSSIPDYNAYAENVLMPRMDQDALKEIKQLEANKDYQNPRYEELLMTNFYVDHMLRMPPDQWPDPVLRAFEHYNPDVYIPMQGPSELGTAGDPLLKDWDRKAYLKNIRTPTLCIGGKYDTMDPEHMKWMAGQFPNGEYLYCPNGSHLSMYDDQKNYFKGLISFIKKVDPQNESVRD